MKKDDLTGKKFGKLTVIKEFSKTKNGNITWMCKCECGNEKEIPGGRLKFRSQSCGCERTRKSVERNVARTKHGMGATKIYAIWKSMLHRCNSSKSKSYVTYGAKGIKVCPEWENFENFYKDMGEPPVAGMSIDRKNNDLGYSKGNCRWATKIEQQNNTSTNRLVDVDGELMTVSQLASRHGLKYHCLYHQLITNGKSVEEAISKLKG